MIRAKPIVREIELLVAHTLSPQVAAERRAKAARTIFARTDAHNARILGSVPPFETFVDGRASEDFKSVRPDGQIVRRYELVLDVLKVISQELKRISPRKTGRYQASHALFADGVEVDANNPPPAREYFFVSFVPYSRKLERKYSVYQNVERSPAVRRFRNSAKISFGYRSVLGGGYLEQWARRTRYPRRGSPAKREDWLRRQPAIIVTTR